MAWAKTKCEKHPQAHLDAYLAAYNYLLPEPEAANDLPTHLSAYLRKPYRTHESYFINLVNPLMPVGNYSYQFFI